MISLPEIPWSPFGCEDPFAVDERDAFQVNDLTPLLHVMPARSPERAQALAAEALGH